MAKQGLVAKTRDRYRQTSNRCKGRILKSSPKGLWPCRTRGAGPRVHGQRLASSGSLTMHDNYSKRTSDKVLLGLRRLFGRLQ